MAQLTVESVNLICLIFISQVLSFSGFVIGYLEGISRVDFVERHQELFAIIKPTL